VSGATNAAQLNALWVTTSLEFDTEFTVCQACHRVHQLRRHYMKLRLFQLLSCTFRRKVFPACLYRVFVLTRNPKFTVPHTLRVTDGTGHRKSIQQLITSVFAGPVDLENKIVGQVCFVLFSSVWRFD
jgi:hypothetical protein